MNRYTLQFRPFEDSITPVELRREVEQVLLRLHPRITYRFGRAYKDVYGKLIAEIAMDGKRRLLEDAMSNKKWDIPIVFERLRWGWFIDNEDAALLVSVKEALNSDPLVGVSPIDGTGEFVLRKRSLQGRYIALMTSSMILILIFIANLIYRNSPIWEGIYIVFFVIFMTTLVDTPIDIRVYAEKITITPANLEVSLWLVKKPVCLEWDKIWGLDYTNPVCTVLSRGGKTRFILSERFGCPEKSVVMKTIVKRAALTYVDGNFQSTIYRKPDAVESN